MSPMRFDDLPKPKGPPPREGPLDWLGSLAVGVVVLIGLVLMFAVVCAMVPWWPWCWV